MHITIISEGAYPVTLGGVSIWTHNLITNLKGHNFAVLCFTIEHRTLMYDSGNIDRIFIFDLNEQPLTGKGDKEVTYRFVKSLLEGKVVEKEVLINAHKVSINSEGFWKAIEEFYMRENMDMEFSKYFWTCIDVISYVLRAIRAIKNYEKFKTTDIYLALNSGLCGIIGSILKLRNSVPLIITEHGILLKEIEIWFEKANLEEPIRKIWRNIFLSMVMTSYNNADVLNPISHYHMDLEVKLGADRRKIWVIYPGINTFRYRPSSTPKRKQKLTVGVVTRITPVKGIKEFIRIASKIKKSIDCDFTVVGPVEDEEYYKECIEEMEKLGVKINFVGKKDPLPYYHIFDVYLNASLSEGVPLAVLEAMSCGVPTVCSDVGACRYIASAVFNSEEEAARIVIRLLMDERRRKALGNMARKRAVREFSLRRMVSEYDTLFYSVFSSKRKERITEYESPVVKLVKNMLKVKEIVLNKTAILTNRS